LREEGGGKPGCVLLFQQNAEDLEPYAGLLTRPTNFNIYTLLKLSSG